MLNSDVLTPDAPITNTPLSHSEKFINHLLDQVSLLREKMKAKDQQINSLLEHASKLDDIYLSKNGSLLPENIKQTNKNRSQTRNKFHLQHQCQHQKRTLKNSDDINVDNNEILPIPNGASLPDSQIVSISEKESPKNTQSNSSNNKKRNHSASKKFINNSKSIIILGESTVKHLTDEKCQIR